MQSAWFLVSGRNGSAFPTPWWGYRIAGWPADGRYFIGDFNGDGAADIPFLATNAKWYIVNGRTGQKFPDPWWSNQLTGWRSDGSYFIGDFNGDGAADIAFDFSVNATDDLLNHGHFPGGGTTHPFWGFYIKVEFVDGVSEIHGPYISYNAATDGMGGYLAQDTVQGVTGPVYWMTDHYPRPGEI